MDVYYVARSRVGLYLSLFPEHSILIELGMVSSLAMTESIENKVPITQKLHLKKTFFFLRQGTD